MPCFAVVALELRSGKAVVEESGSEKCSETALSLAADDVFENYWWYAFNTNV
jgi:hypothetical protein